MLCEFESMPIHILSFAWTCYSIPLPSFQVLQELLSEGAELIPGRMECGEDGPTFVPGMSMELNGAKTFIPGNGQRPANSAYVTVR